MTWENENGPFLSVFGRVPNSQFQDQAGCLISSQAGTLSSKFQNSPEGEAPNRLKSMFQAVMAVQKMERAILYIHL
jgi:hypothetical protein